jgi:hypothetical protein
MFGICLLPAALAGCATVFDGTAQTIVLDVTPVDADCTGWSKGELVGIYYPTFHTISVPRSRHDLTLLCSAYGYEDALVALEPAPGPWDVPASNGVDYLTGARHEYDQAVVIVMDKIPHEFHKAPH